MLDSFLIRQRGRHRSALLMLLTTLAMARFLIPDIVDDVFRLLKNSDLAQIARLSRSWSELALDRLWDDGLLSILPLLKILAPLTIDRSRNAWVG